MIRKNLSCRHCGKSLIGLNRSQYCSDYCGHTYKAVNAAKLRDLRARQITVKAEIDRLSRYIPRSWEEADTNLKILTLRREMDNLDFELGDY